MSLTTINIAANATTTIDLEAYEVVTSAIIRGTAILDSDVILEDEDALFIRGEGRIELNGHWFYVKGEDHELYRLDLTGRGFRPDMAGDAMKPVGRVFVGTGIVVKPGMLYKLPNGKYATIQKVKTTVEADGSSKRKVVML